MTKFQQEMDESTDTSIENLEVQVGQLSWKLAARASENAKFKEIELLNKVVQLEPKVQEKDKEVVV